MTAPWNAAAWIERWEAAGGGWAAGSERLAFLLPDKQDALPDLMAEIVGHPERLAKVRERVEQRC